MLIHCTSITLRICFLFLLFFYIKVHIEDTQPITKQITYSTLHTRYALQLLTAEIPHLHVAHGRRRRIVNREYCIYYTIGFWGAVSIPYTDRDTRRTMVTSPNKTTSNKIHDKQVQARGGTRYLYPPASSSPSLPTYHYNRNCPQMFLLWDGNLLSAEYVIKHMFQVSLMQFNYSDALPLRLGDT